MKKHQPKDFRPEVNAAITACETATHAEEEVLADLAGEQSLTHLLEIQRDLAIQLLPCANLRDCLDLLFASAMRLPGFDCGGIYLCDEETGGLRLIAHCGLSDDFVKQASNYSSDTPQASLVRSGKLVYFLRSDLPPALAAVIAAEGLEALAVLPLHDQGTVIAALNVSSRIYPRIKQDSRVALESLMALAEVAIASIREREARQIAERRLRLAVEGANLGTWMADFDRGKLDACDLSRELHGMTADEPLTLESAVNAIHPDDREMAADAVQETLKDGNPFSCVYRTAASDGERWLASDARIANDSSGKLLYGIVRDITRQKQDEAALIEARDQLETRVAERTAELEGANAALREQSNRLEMALDASQAVTWGWTIGSDLVEWDNRARAFYGFDDDVAVSFGDYLKRLHPEDREMIVDHQRRINQPGLPDTWNHEFRIDHPVLGERWISGMGRVERDAEGQARHLVGINFDITGRKSIEQALRQSEQKYRKLHESMMDAFASVGLDGHIVESNRAFQEMLGYTHEELSQLTYIDITPEKWHKMEARMATDGQFFSRGYSDLYEKEYRRKDGTVFSAELRAFLIRDPDDQPAAVCAIVRDITERKRAEQALYESNELLSEFMRCSPIYSYIKLVTPTESRVLLASENYREMIGIPGSCMVGKTMDELFPPMIAGKITTDDWAVVSSGGMLKVDEEMNGRSYSSIKFPIVQGERTLLAGYTIDVTERKLTEQTMLEWNKTLERRVAMRTEELNLSEIRFRQLAEATFEGIGISENGILVDGNPQLALMHGCELAEMIGRPVLDFVAPESRALVTKHIREGRETPYECFGLRKDGSIFAEEVNGRMRMWHGKKTRVTALRDLTQVKQSAARLQSQQTALEHAQRLGLVSEVSAGIIHQIGQPLCGMGANLAAALATVGTCETQRCGALEIIKDVDADVASMRDAVVHLRALASPGKATRAPFDFNAMVADVLRLIRQEAAGHQVGIESDLSSELPPLEGDSVQLGQVILNLLRNAFDSCGSSPPDLRAVRIATRLTDGGTIELSVRDSGGGIRPEAMDGLFAPFFTTKPDGLGMGLRLSQTIVHAHGGTIDGQNNSDGCGATFRVLLPVNSKS